MTHGIPTRVAIAAAAALLTALPSAATAVPDPASVPGDTSVAPVAAGIPNGNTYWYVGAGESGYEYGYGLLHMLRRGNSIKMASNWNAGEPGDSICFGSDGVIRGARVTITMRGNLDSREVLRVTRQGNRLTIRDIGSGSSCVLVGLKSVSWTKISKARWNKLVG